MPLTSSANAGSGTPTSSSSSDPFASTAGIAYRRAATNASPSSGSSVENTSVAPCSVNTAAMYSASSAPAGPRSSVAATIIAAALRSSPILSLSSTALIATPSMNSSIDGRILPVMVTTASAAAATESNEATTVHPRCWAGSSFSVTSVTTPRVPSLPTKSFVRLSPATSFSRGPPRRTAVPSASTTCRPST